KVSGSRFHYLTGFGAKLEMALLNLARDVAEEAGFSPTITPTLVRPEVMRGTGFLGEHADEIYRLEADDLFLVGTSAVPLAGFHTHDIAHPSSAPARDTAIPSRCRRQARCDRKQTRGIPRVHQSPQTARSSSPPVEG